MEGGNAVFNGTVKTGRKFVEFCRGDGRGKGARSKGDHGRGAEIKKKLDKTI
jgi:hypothetical protein